MTAKRAGDWTLIQSEINFVVTYNLKLFANCLQI